MKKKEEITKMRKHKTFPKSTKKKSRSKSSYNNKLVKKYSSEIKKYKAKVNLLKNINKFAIPSILIIAILAVLVFYKPGFTGYFALENVSSYTQDINKLFVENSTYLLNLEKGELKSLRINGQLIGNGSAKVYLETDNESYLVFDSYPSEKVGLDSITGFAVSDFNETPEQEINESVEINETLGFNETVPINETLEQEINESVEINETLVLNETVNETVLVNETAGLNETVPLNETPEQEINKTIGLNETLKNVTVPPENAEILIELGYNNGTEFDADNNGIEAKDGIVDFNVNAEFNWNINEGNLCTKWETNSLDDGSSVTVCYGNEICCNFVGLEPLTANWDEVFYSYYERYGATANNKISAQVVYVNYSISEENPYSYIYYSDWDSLNTVFLDEEEKTTEFNDICIETCQLSLNETSYRLRIELENATLILDNISYTMIPKDVEKVNNAPELLMNIPGITIPKNGKFSIDLSKYFSDKDNDSLNYKIYEMNNISVFINESIATFTPNKTFTGVRHSFVIANDSESIAVSNVFKINVTEEFITENITGENITSFLNVSETPTQLKAEINKPVKWIKTVFAENNETINKTVNISFSLPGQAFNISVRDIKLNKIIENNKIIVKNKTNAEDEILEIDKAFVFNNTFSVNEILEGDIIPPNPIKSLQVVNTSGIIVLNWTNPDNSDFAGVKVLRKQDVYPDINYSKAITDNLVINITDKIKSQTTLLDDNVTVNVTYYYRVYSYDNSFNYASGRGVLAVIRSIEENEVITKNKIVTLNEINNKNNLEANERQLEFEELLEPNKIKEYSIEYETSAPASVEKKISSVRKQIIISSDIHYTNVLAYTSITEITGEQEKIRLYWVRNNTRELFTNVSYYDLNNNSLIDWIEWVVPHLSNQTFEVEIEVLNVQSYPTIGGNWTVIFNTIGASNLTISAVNKTSYSELYDDDNLTIDDLRILELRCGDKILFNKDSFVNNNNLYFILDNNSLVKLNETIGKKLKIKSLFVKDYYCNSTGYYTVNILTPGEHNQEFKFNDQTAYAHNFATDLIKASTLYYEFNCPKCVEDYDSNPVNFCPTINSWRGKDDFEAEISFDIEYVEQVSSASICAYQGYTWYEEPFGYQEAINYIEKINSSQLSAAPERFGINESWVNKTMSIYPGWKCINITTMVQDTVENNETKLYARWWGQDVNGSRGPFVCFKGFAQLSECDGDNPSGALDCRPYLNIT